MEQNPVAKMSSAQSDMEGKRKLPRLLMEGTEAMRAAGTTYLPKFPAESQEGWQARRDCTTLAPGFRDAVDLACSLIFRREVEEGEGVPTDAEEWLDDIDLTGRDVTQFAKDVFQQALTDGIGYILVDYPRVAPGATLATEKAMKARPYLVHIRAEQVLGWRTMQINGKPTLIQFRYQECVTVPDGEFGEKENEQIRVIEPGMVSVYVKNSNNEWLLDAEASGATTMLEVCVVPVYTGRCGVFMGHPPLLDLAWKNVEHWQSSSDQRNILHVARVPILTLIGADGDVVLGSKAVLILPVGGDAKWTEHSGKAIEAGRQDLLDLKDEMQQMAGKMLDKGSVKTATEAGVESTQAMSRIQAWALGLNAALNQAWELAGKWIKTDLGTLAVNTDLDTSKPDATFLTEMRNAVIGGLLSKETYLKILMSAEVLPDGFDLQEELDRIAIQAPELAPIPARGPAPKAGPKNATITRPDGSKTTVSMED